MSGVQQRAKESNGSDPPGRTGRERKAAVTNRLSHGASWVGPYQIRKMLELSIGWKHPRRDTKTAYVITRSKWDDWPSPDSGPLYVGGTTGKNPRFWSRLGDLIADLFGFFTDDKTSSHHAGARSIRKWCRHNEVNPLDLYLAWVKGNRCHRCLETELFERVMPELNKIRPPLCKLHIKSSLRTPTNRG
jgi:hypothetical protein